MKLNLIAAVSIDGAIGDDQQLLWNIPEDLKHYKEKTLDNIVIMGINTFLNLPGNAKKKRTYFIITGDDTRTIEDIEEEDIITFKTLEEVIVYLKSFPKYQKIFVGGGETIFNSMINLCDTAEITWVNKMYPEANKRFPLQYLFDNFELIEDSNWVKSRTGLLYKICNYKKC